MQFVFMKGYPLLPVSTISKQVLHQRWYGLLESILNNFFYRDY